MDKKVIWEPHYYEFNTLSGGIKEVKEGEETDFLESEKDNLLPAAFDFYEEKPRDVVNTPFGIWAVDDSMNPYKHFKFYIAHTNFNISKSVSDLIIKFPGIEVYREITRYRFLIAVGKCFDTTEVRANLTNALIGKKEHVKHNLILSDGNPLDGLLQDLNQSNKDWAVYVFPNGKYSVVTSDDTDFENKRHVMKLSKNYSNGTFLESAKNGNA